MIYGKNDVFESLLAAIDLQLCQFVVNVSVSCFGLSIGLENSSLPEIALQNELLQLLPETVETGAVVFLLVTYL